MTIFIIVLPWLPASLTFISMVWTQVQSDEEEELAAMRLFDEIDVNKDGVWLSNQI